MHDIVRWIVIIAGMAGTGLIILILYDWVRYLRLSHLRLPLHQDRRFRNFALDLGHLDDLVCPWFHLRLPGCFRSTHMYVVGVSGSGKSSLLKNLIIQDIESRMGIAVIDPHGDLVYDIIPFLGERAADTWIIDLADTEHMLAYNPMELHHGVPVAEQVAKLVLAFKRIWADSWGPRLERILRDSLSLLIEHKLTLAEYELLLTDADFREMLLQDTEDEQAKLYFERSYNQLPAKERLLQIESSVNKVSAFLADERLGLRMSQPESSFTIREIMDSGGILLVNLAKGKLGGNADLFGAILMADIEMSFLAREKGQRSAFALYVDEFQNIATESFGTVLVEARKFGISLTVANQSLAQLERELVQLILGNAQTQVYFRTSREDSEILAKESANVIAELEEQHERLRDKVGELRLNLAGLWEEAYFKLASLEQRQALVHVKAAQERPTVIRTLESPAEQSVEFEYGSKYETLDSLNMAHRSRLDGLEQKIREYVESR